MNTWISRGVVFALSAFGLAACETAPTNSGARSLPTQALLANGAVLLVAPAGYCVDTRSKKDAFALLARCDTMGGETGAGVPLGVITATALPATSDRALPDAAEFQATRGVRRVFEQFAGRSQTLVRAEGPAPAPGLSTLHWRGTTRVGGHMLAVAVYGPEGSAATGREGRQLAQQVMARSRSGTDALLRSRQAAGQTPAAP
ncbi:hypothetical protein R5H30_09890 [Sulfitobacter sp. D35]|uniref:hypothetical protein n=1 Tax=Sulfitobacter sp. D35 TaxID=3083252 RepID=UPI00296E8062|nr:hypothetical protein [Sulfitobacter sp. D35]MDW4498289.1 hypothetical protein [Sulfitobacter sp. D35]